MREHSGLNRVQLRGRGSGCEPGFSGTNCCAPVWSNPPIEPSASGLGSFSVSACPRERGSVLSRANYICHMSLYTWNLLLFVVPKPPFPLLLLLLLLLLPAGRVFRPTAVDSHSHCILLVDNKSVAAVEAYRVAQ